MDRKIIIKNIIEQVMQIDELSNWNKQQIDLLSFFMGITELSKSIKLFDDFDISFQEKYFEVFGENFSKKKIELNLLNNHMFLTNDLSILVKLFFKNKLSKKEYETYFGKVLFADIKEKGKVAFSENSTEAKILNYCEKNKKNKLSKDDVDTLSRELKITDVRVRQVMEKIDVGYITKSQIEKEEQKMSFDFMMSYLSEGGFVKVGKCYWINKNAEIWKQSDNGFRKVLVIERKNNTGSEYCITSIDSKQVHVHKLIAELFIENPNNYKYVRALDGNFKNLSATNFEWVKYPAATRVLNSLGGHENSWLNFVIDNFISGVNITDLSKILADISKRKKLFLENSNHESTIDTVIRKYAKGTNDLFPIFEIKKEFNNSVFIDKDILKKVRKND